MGDISLFDNAKQVASFAGLNPKIIQSGTGINKSSLSKMGYKKLRKPLYMPALVAIRYNPLMLDLFQYTHMNTTNHEMHNFEVNWKLPPH
jgi:transposase